MDIKVGNKVYIVDNYNVKNQKYVEIVRVGRKYFYTENQLKFDKETLHNVSDRNWSPYQIYPSKENYLEIVEKIKLWNDFKEKYRYSAPSCSLDTLKQAIALLTNSEQDLQDLQDYHD
jgi:hypothetical protein